MAQYRRRNGADLLLIALGNPHVGGSASDWLCGWSKNEIQCGVGCSAPQNNLWACGEYVLGASDWNPQGVKNYPSLVAMISAMVTNLHDGRYNNLLTALQADNITSLTDGSVAPDLATWCGSTCYSGATAQFIALGQSAANDLFDENASATTGNIPDCNPDGSIPDGASTCNPQWCNKLDITQKPACIKCSTIKSSQCADGDTACEQSGVIFCQSCVYQCYNNLKDSGFSTTEECIAYCYDTASGKGNATPAFPDVTKIDLGTAVKIGVGLVLLVFGGLLAYSILTGKSTVASKVVP